MMRNTLTLCLLSACLAACAAQETDGADEMADGDTETSAIAPSGATPDEPGEPAYGEGDAKVAGTDYHATTVLDCGFENAKPTQTCKAGVTRNWGDDGTNLVEVQKPDGFTRAIFLRGTQPYGADSAQADGSAGWDFTTTRDGDRVTVRFGPETYVLVDAFVEGG